MSNSIHQSHTDSAFVPSDESDWARELEALSNAELWISTLSANATRRRATARLLVHLVAIEKRRLHLVQGYSSLYDLCVRGLGMGEGHTHRSISGARAAHAYPLALEMLADGRLHLTGLSLIASRLTDENHAQLLEEVAGKTKAEIQIVLARWFPKPDVPDRVEPVAGSGTSEKAGTGTAQGRLGLDGAPTCREPAGPYLEPRSEGRFAVHFSGSATLKAKLEHAQNLMSHVSRELEVVFERALDALIRELENKQWGKTDRPRRARGTKDGRPTRAAKRDVYERDRAQCSYVAPSGVRCTTRAFLQYHHIHARGLGGSGGAENGRVYCAAHNQFHARQTYGDETIDEKIRRAKQGASQSSAAPPEAVAERTKAPPPRQPASVIGKPTNDKRDKLRAALATLGFNKADCRQVVAALGADTERLPIEQLIREALARLTSR